MTIEDKMVARVSWLREKIALLKGPGVIYSQALAKKRKRYEAELAALLPQLKAASWEPEPKLGPHLPRQSKQPKFARNNDTNSVNGFARGNGW